MPKDYLEFMAVSNGAEGELNNTYLRLWPVEELIELNRGMMCRNLHPIFLLSDRTALTRRSRLIRTRGEYYEMPLILMSAEEAIALGNDFKTFVETLSTRD
ncbi:hypothetical protein [Chryseolinea lacunae]|uniref:SMI1/KNR4 family protein n=1 Tax=Chryseolinea lacunae TaxID=2801331 RepID=A0ABS1KPC9_9BACT|nr:hypothetical protein [Chryseolinea lacunae]MBL0741214.1 hypothetical protein [Chryseolinea lacunae]